MTAPSMDETAVSRSCASKTTTRPASPAPNRTLTSASSWTGLTSEAEYATAATKSTRAKTNQVMNDPENGKANEPEGRAPG